jgi:hypothetical protein
MRNIGLPQRSQRTFSSCLFANFAFDSELMTIAYDFNAKRALTGRGAIHRALDSTEKDTRAMNRAPMLKRSLVDLKTEMIEINPHGK